MEMTEKLCDEENVLFIAEVGVNHDGDLSRAKTLVDAAVDAGADAVKFQTFNTDRLVANGTPAAAYQNATFEEERDQRELIRKYELCPEDHEELWSYCQDAEITLLSTPFDTDSVHLLEELGIPAFKVGSGDLTNHPLLAEIAGIGRPMIVSTGMATMEEVDAAHDAIRAVNESVTVAFLHCVSAYPTDRSDTNLAVIQALGERFDGPVGFSDHTMSVKMPGLAVAAGASIIEKHLTLNRTLKGPDHRVSLEPDQFAKAVEGARLAARARGTTKKAPTRSEQENRIQTRRSLHAVRAIDEGETISSDAVEILRPATGLAPAALDGVIGSTAATDMKPHDPIVGKNIRGWEDDSAEAREPEHV